MANYSEKVLIGIISKNRANILPTAIQSALIQEGVSYQVAVFDDHSTDHTRTLEGEFPQVAWYFSDQDQGYVYGRNKLMRETDASFYCSLDDDSWFMKNNELKIALQVLEERPEVAAIAFDILSPDRPLPVPVSEPFETNMFIGCGHVLRLSAVREVGYYEPNPGFYGGEEKDLCIKLMDKDYKIVKLPGIHVWHDKTMVARNLKQQHRSGVCNDMVFAFRRTPASKVAVALLFKTLSHLRFSIIYKQEKLIQPCLQGLADFYTLVLKQQIKRGPVSGTTFKKYLSFKK